LADPLADDFNHNCAQRGPHRNMTIQPRAGADSAVAIHCGDYTSKLSAILAELDSAGIEEVVRLFIEARDRGSRIIFIGNGGSASTASHFAIDIGIGTRGGERPFRAISLTDNNAILTALANDFGYDEVFVRQLSVMMMPGDLVVAISASGNSPNILKAVEFANARGNHSVGLTGFDGGRLKELSATSVHVATPVGEYGIVEDVHLVINHIITSHLRDMVKAEGR
jgi:D-sedoheptulose 7-phosphate isomerase